jgi:hypothetical protein
LVGKLTFLPQGGTFAVKIQEINVQNAHEIMKKEKENKILSKENSDEEGKKRDKIAENDGATDGATCYTPGATWR